MMSVLQSDDLKQIANENIFNETEPCHIYIIGTRPRITVIKESFLCRDDSFDLSFKIWDRDDGYIFTRKFSNPFENKNVELNTEYPYNIFHLRTHSDCFSIKTASFLGRSTRYEPNNDFLNIKVLYVGQSYGTEGTRTSPDRLRSHSTLQSILSEASSKNPDQEIWLFLMSFKQLGLMLFDGRNRFTEEERKSNRPRTDEFMRKMSKGGITEQQFINFTEAALIKYFQPAYNVIYKDSFPNPAHKTYTECFDLDVNSINVEIGSRDAVDIMLYSDFQPPKPIHFATFLMHDKNDRVSMFDLNYVLK